MRPELRDRLKNVTNLPTPPAVAAQVINLAQQPEVSLTDVAEAITCDASLTAKVLRVANSSMYAQRRQSSNLRQALVVLGLNATVTLALGFSLLPMLRRSPQQNQHLAYIWRRGVLSAISARVLADKIRDLNSEEAFLGALLQDIGVMAIDRIQPDFYAAGGDIYKDHARLIAYEKEHLGADHAAAGAWLLAHWDLPQYLQDAVDTSHSLDADMPDEQRLSFMRCIALSGLIADLWLCDCDDEAAFAEIAAVAETAVGIDRATFAMVLSEVGGNIPDMAAMFETELVSEQEAQMIVERAHEALMMRNLKSIHEVAELGRKTRQLKTLTTSLREATQTDALTRVANRGHLDKLLTKGFRHAKRFGWTISIAFIDLDHFKNVNDIHGHQAGDEVLRNVGALLADQVRSSDTVGRYGGEEFMLILPGADEDGVLVVAERVLAAIRELKHPVPNGQSIQVTASIGCVTLAKGNDYETMTEMVGAADKALYAAKDRGRNCVVRYGEDQARETA